MSEDEAQYNDSNRAFLQAFMARGSLTFEEAKPILAFIFSVHGSCTALLVWVSRWLTVSTEGREVLSEDITQQDIDSYIGAANAAISPLDLEIRSASHQASRTRVYALVNTTSDSMMQLATTYTADEIGFVKRVLDAMFETYNTRRQEAMVITSMQAVQLAKPDASRRETQNGSATQGSSGQGLSMSQAENMLKRLVEEGWFEKSRKGYYSLSPRALLELRGWLVSTYNEAADEDAEENTGRNDRIKFCYACKEIITVVSDDPIRTL